MCPNTEYTAYKLQSTANKVSQQPATTHQTTIRHIDRNICSFTEKLLLVAASRQSDELQQKVMIHLHYPTGKHKQ